GNAPDITPTVSQQAVCAGNSVTLTASGMINGGVVTGWVYSDNGLSWNLISNSAGASYTHNVTLVTTTTTRRYRALILTGCSTDSTSERSVLIDVPLEKPTISNPGGTDSLIS